MPKYAKFLKELCTNKKKHKGEEKMYMGESGFALIQRKLSPKVKDPGLFIIQCSIHKTRHCKAMLNLGASINVMLYSVFLALNINGLKEIDTVIQLVDKSNIYPRGLLEDVLVNVENLLFLTDFYVIDMKNDGTISTPPLLLGRPFMTISRTKIDVFNGSLTLEFEDEIGHFKIFNEKVSVNFMQFCFSINSVNIFCKNQIE
ncbi:hypothetical protein REPUB_Repub20aG0073600 [Reevesia pubescens]